MREAVLKALSFDSFRLRGAEPAILAALFVAPLLCSLYWNSFRVNLVAGLLLMLLVLVRPPRIDARWFDAPARTWAGGWCLVAGLFLVSWQWHHGDLWLNSQFLLYLGIALAFPVIRDWFEETGSNGLSSLFSVKLGTILGAAVLILLASLQVSDDTGAGTISLREDAVIYRHLRHFNYDQMAVIVICTWWAALRVGTAQRLLSYGVLAFMGYLLGVLGARGALVATFVYLATVLAFRVVARRAAIYWALAIVGGVLLSVVLGQADLLLRQAEKTLTGTNITSHRWELWTGSVSVWLESWRSFLFGFGPDAFHTYVRSQIGYPPNVHPHNAFVQAVIEFGLLGLVAFLGLLTLIARRALAVLTSAAASLEARLCAAGLAGFGAYMLVDGILFHALPLSFVAILTAFVFSAPQRGLPRAAGA